MADLLVIVPSRGRPESVPRMVDAWLDTDAYEHARLVFVIDADDPRHGAYFAHDLPAPGHAVVEVVTVDTWQPMVHKLNQAAVLATTGDHAYSALAFHGDDHVPRTPGWAGLLVDELAALGTGIAYGNDLLQRERLPTAWAMTADIVRTLGRMVPAPVEHLYCDNAIKDLGEAAGCLRYLPDVVIEHMHPLAGKATPDAGYRRVNSRAQYARDAAAYRAWRNDRLAADAAAVRALREVRAG